MIQFGFTRSLLFNEQAQGSVGLVCDSEACGVATIERLLISQHDSVVSACNRSRCHFVINRESPCGKVVELTTGECDVVKVLRSKTNSAPGFFDL